jgi:hypothetical protein
LKVIVPVAELDVTDAVKVIDVPNVAGFAPLDSVVVVDAADTLSATLLVATTP